MSAITNDELRRGQRKRFVVFMAPGLAIEFVGIAYMVWQIRHGVPVSAFVPAGIMIVIFGTMLTAVGIVAYSVKKRQAGG